MSEDINKMFSKIYLQYDRMNHLFSFGIDKEWRREAAKESILNLRKYKAIDVAAGTGDLSIEIAKLAGKEGKDVTICASDFNKDMLQVAKGKLERKRLKNIYIKVEDAYNLKQKSGSFDLLASGFGLRSFRYSKRGEAGLRKFIAESYRVLKKNGKVVLLDMAMPDGGFQRTFFQGYSVMMKFTGSFVDSKTYGWLVDTIRDFDKQKLLATMKAAGFRNVKIRNLKSGIAFIATGEK